MTFSARLRVHEFFGAEILVGEKDRRNDNGNPFDMRAIHRRADSEPDSARLAIIPSGQPDAFRLLNSHSTSESFAGDLESICQRFVPAQSAAFFFRFLGSRGSDSFPGRR